jgi:hypothetical protein
VALSKPELTRRSSNSIDNNPDLHFLIVINPNSGPGEPPAPDANYSRELPLFNAKENVTTVGYVRMQYCKRSVEQVFDDVTVYGGWSKDHEATGNGIYVEGIFLDEAPNEWSHDVGKYLNVVSEKIKNTPGILGEKLVSRRPCIPLFVFLMLAFLDRKQEQNKQLSRHLKLTTPTNNQSTKIIHNPGTVPDRELTQARPEVTAVFEEGYSRYRSCGQGEQRALDAYDRKGASYILHSVPRNQVIPLVRELRPRAEYIFVTDRQTRYYEGFGESWNDFIRAMVE